MKVDSGEDQSGAHAAIGTEWTSGLPALPAKPHSGDDVWQQEAVEYAAGYLDDAGVNKLMGVPREYRLPARPAKKKDTDRIGALVLAATDPANAYGAALPWPQRPVGPDGTAVSGHRPGRKAGALVVSVDGELVIYVERGGRTLLSWSEDPELLQPAVDALALTVRDGWLGKLTVSKTDGEDVLSAGSRDSALGRALTAAGFRSTPQGLRLRG